MNIAIDAMGGDHTPAEIAKGALEASREISGEIILVGDETKIKKYLDSGKGDLSKIQIRHTDQYIEMDETPSLALRKKKDASIIVAAKLLKKKEAAALISAGNTGAIMEAVVLNVGRIRHSNIKRPALSVVLPTYRQSTILLDAGANAECKPAYLLQFAKMGCTYARNILDRPNPRVGLMNIGSEEKKGNAITVAAYELLSQSGINFIGNVEPSGLMNGDVDVAVADGFVGNMVLKTAEGTAEFFTKVLKDLIKSEKLAMLGALFQKNVFRKLKEKMDHSEHGGALLFGVDGICIKAHGKSDAKTIVSAIRLAERMAKQDIIRKFAEDMAGDTADEEEERREGEISERSA